MTVWIVIQNTKTVLKVRGVFSTKQRAENYIELQNIQPLIKCITCGEQRPNPAYDSSKSRKDKLFIREWVVE